MSFFDTLLGLVTAGAAKLAQGDLNGLLTQATSDSIAFVVDSRSALDRWATLRRDNLITDRELSDLIRAQAALAQMADLTKSGIALTRLDRFKAELAQLVISSALTALGV